MTHWPDIHLPPINLYTVPKHMDINLQHFAEALKRGAGIDKSDSIAAVNLYNSGGDYMAVRDGVIAVDAYVTVVEYITLIMES